MIHKKYITPKKWVALGVPFIFAAGAALHFAYPLSGKNISVTPFAPVNESIWEHTKMAYAPTVLWWGGYYKKNKDKLNADKWFSASLTALLVCIAAMPMGYYLYTGILGRHFLAADISLLALSAAAAQAMGHHVYKHGKGKPGAVASAAIIAAIGAIYTFFTFHAPRIPLFCDPLTGKYGIK